jgi:hypothetical protein
MAQSIVIHGLVSKRAELSGEISEAEKRLERLRADLDSLDATIRLLIQPWRRKPSSLG